MPTPIPVEATLEARIDSVFRDHDSTHSPGCAVGVVGKHGTTFSRGYGMANLDHRVPIEPWTIFDVASVSKQFTAAVVLLLDREGALSLDDDIRDFLPGLPDYGERVTIRHLIHHTSGLRDYLVLLTLTGVALDETFDGEDVFELVARQEALNFPPGENFLYSNTGYFLISRIVREVTGQSLREYARDHLFRPLGMERTHFQDDPNEVVRYRAIGYAPRGSNNFVERRRPLHLVGDGGLMTSVEDLAIWERTFLGELPPNGDHRRELVSFLRERMAERGRLSDQATLLYSFGLTHGVHRRLPTSGHGGSFMGYQAEVLRFPGEDTSVTVLCNLSAARPRALAREVADIILEGELGPRQEPAERRSRPVLFRGSSSEEYEPFPEELEELSGDYYSEELGVTYRLRVRYGGLRIDEPAPLASHLVPEGRDTYRLGEVVLRFLRDDSGDVKELRLDAVRALDLRFERLPDRLGDDDRD